MVQARILVVDDEANARHALAEILREEGYAVEIAADGFKALPKLVDFDPELLVTDLKMPGMDGLELMSKVQKEHPDVGVILMTAFGEVETAVKAIRAGAADYLQKPLNADQLLVVVANALERCRLRKETQKLHRRLDERYGFANIVGDSPQIQQVFKIIEQVAPSRANVLISGESGTGKEMIAAAIHQRSPRQRGPFIKLHCAALSESLLESELFGHEKGSFTGADCRREGRFELANGGTLFLDEIGEISPGIQVKLLRVLQERAFERVGGNQTIRTDVRVIAATNRDLRQLVAEGTFREDLFYRLDVVNIRMPALRERSSDIPALAAHFARKYADENQKPVPRIADGALARLAAYRWPGNVRELENVIERAVVLSSAASIEAPELPPQLLPIEDTRALPLIPGARLADVERYAILHTVEACGGSTSKAAETLGISVRKIQYKLLEYAAAPKSDQPAVTRGTAVH